MNSTMPIYSTLLTLESLDISPSLVLPVCVLGVLTYCAILFFNITLLLTIALNRKLHKPMYILLFNMPINDILGASAYFPQMVFHVMSKNRYIMYSACYIQAFLVHLYGTGAFLILTVMAYDRYVAICIPLKYNTLMSSNNLLKIIISVWTLSFITNFLILFARYYQKICSTNIVDTFCNNPSLMNLICDKDFHNYGGLLLTLFQQILTKFVMLFTYIHILITCVSKRQSDSKSKAIQTCGTHLVVYFCLEFSVLFSIISHRFANVSPYLRGVFATAVMIVPPFVNPLIYGLKTRKIREKIYFFSSKKIFQ